MTRRRSSEPTPKIREGRSLGDGEPTVVRPAEEPSWAEEMWHGQNDPHRPENHHLGKRFYGQLMGNLGDEAFLISMRNRLLVLERERAAPEFWRAIKALLFGASEETALSGFEIKRLKRLAGEAEPDSLPDLTDVDVSYDELKRLVSATESAERQDRANHVDHRHG